MAFPNLTCVRTESISLAAGATHTIVTNVTTTDYGLYMWNFAEDMLSPNTSSTTVTAGAALVEVNNSARAEFFHVQTSLGHVDTAAAGVNTITLVITATSISLQNTRATPCTATLFVYKYA